MFSGPVFSDSPVHICHKPAIIGYCVVHTVCPPSITYTSNLDESKGERDLATALKMCSALPIQVCTSELRLFFFVRRWLNMATVEYACEFVCPLVQNQYSVTTTPCTCVEVLSWVCICVFIACPIVFDRNKKQSIICVSSRTLMKIVCFLLSKIDSSRFSLISS